MYIHVHTELVVHYYLTVKAHSFFISCVYFCAIAGIKGMLYIGTTYQVVFTYQCGGQIHIRVYPCMHNILWMRGETKRPPDRVCFEPPGSFNC